MPGCKKCGFLMPEDSAFCPSCGAPLKLRGVMTLSGVNGRFFVAGTALCLVPAVLRLADYMVYYVRQRNPLSYVFEALFRILGLPISNIALIQLIDLIPPLIGIVLLWKAFHP